jgi:4-carboxymuconolactone decarboxylase
LQSHFNVGFNVGLTEAQMQSLIIIIESKVGKREAGNANEMLRRVLNSRVK